MDFKQSLIDNDSIRLNQSASTWEEAIKIGTDLLVKAGTIEPRYYDNIISSVKKLGPYIVIAPNFAMPHARPEEGVIKTSFALVSLEKPVYFDGEEEPVDVLVTLAGSDSDQHMEGLLQVTRFLDDPDSETGIDLDKVRRCKTKEDIYAAIDAALKQ